VAVETLGGRGLYARQQHVQQRGLADAGLSDEDAAVSRQAGMQRVQPRLGERADAEHGITQRAEFLQQVVQRLSAGQVRLVAGHHGPRAHQLSRGQVAVDDERIDRRLGRANHHDLVEVGGEDFRPAARIGARQLCPPRQHVEHRDLAVGLVCPPAHPVTAHDPQSAAADECGAGVS
jgi:hypothetical protein